MGKVIAFIISIIIIISIIAWGVVSCESDSVGTTEIGDFKEILKLSVLSIDYEDAYVITRNIGTDENVAERKIVYKVCAQGEYKFNLEKDSVEIDTANKCRTIYLPPCKLEVSLKEAPQPVYVQKDGKLIGAMNINDEDEKEYRKELKDSIEARMNNEVYHQMALKHAEQLLKSFFKNVGVKDSIKVEELK